MNTLSLFNPSFSPDVFDFFDRSVASTRPDVDVRETEAAYLLEMDLPGKTDKDVEISLKDRVLTIASITDARTEEKKGDSGEYLIRERRSSCFTRRFTLPEDIDAERVEANFRNGVLAISIPRRPETQSRQITIKSA